MPGENIALNWSLVEDGITPMENSYRNLPVKQLMQHSKGKLGPNKSLVVAPGAAPSTEPSLDTVVDDLSNTSDVYVVDGAIGSYRGSEILARVVTDDPDFALIMDHLLVKIGGASNEQTGSDHPIKVFHSSNGQPGISSSVTDVDAKIVVTGNVELGAVQETLVQVNDALMATGSSSLDVVFVQIAGSGILTVCLLGGYCR